MVPVKVFVLKPSWVLVPDCGVRAIALPPPNAVLFNVTVAPAPPLETTKVSVSLLGFPAKAADIVELELVTLKATISPVYVPAPSPPLEELVLPEPVEPEPVEPEPVEPEPVEPEPVELEPVEDEPEEPLLPVLDVEPLDPLEDVEPVELEPLDPLEEVDPVELEPLDDVLVVPDEREDVLELLAQAAKINKLAEAANRIASLV